jgi:hypothetical protein
MYLRDPEDTGLYLHDPSVAESAAPLEEFRCDCGISLEYPVHDTLPREAAIDVAMAFFQTGILPRIKEWTE